MVDVADHKFTYTEYRVVDPGNKYIKVFHLKIGGKDACKYNNETLIPPLTGGKSYCRI